MDHARPGRHRRRLEARRRRRRRQNGRTRHRRATVVRMVSGRPRHSRPRMRQLRERRCGRGRRQCWACGHCHRAQGRTSSRPFHGESSITFLLSLPSWPPKLTHVSVPWARVCLPRVRLPPTFSTWRSPLGGSLSSRPYPSTSALLRPSATSLSFHRHYGGLSSSPVFSSGMQYR